MVVVGDDVARRPQPVAVERGADLAAVGEGDRRRAVPRLHQRRVVFVEGLALRIHQRVAGPGLGDQHHHRMRQRVAAGDQDLQRVVDAGGVGLAVRDQRPHLVEIRPDQVGCHRPAPRIHPVDVAADGVDLAVMRQEAVRVRQLPGREGVGREALMHQRQRRLRSAGCADPGRSCRPAAPAAGPCRPRSGSRTTACRVRSGRAVPCLLRQARGRCSGSACGSARILRSNASWSRDRGLAATMAWRITGIVSITVSPSPVRSVGTSRQPTQRLALLARRLLEVLDRRTRGRVASRGRKHIATA